jgi:hypothetical protein
MHRNWIGLIVALLMFACGVYANREYRRRYMPFSVTSHYEQFVEPGGLLRGTSNESLDGHRVDDYCITFSSTENARREFESGLQNAERVLERSPLFDVQGSKTWERVVVLKQPNRHGAQWSSVYYLNGSKSCATFGDSLHHVLEYEQSTHH